MAAARGARARPRRLGRDAREASRAGGSAAARPSPRWTASSPPWRRAGEARPGHRHEPRDPGLARARDRRQGRRARADPRRDSRERPRLDRGLSGARQDADRAAVRPGPGPILQASAVHARSPSGGRHRKLPLRSAPGALRVPRGSRLHQPPAGRRDQPRHAQDAGRAPGGDAGGAGHGRRRILPARAAVPGHRDAEPDRARGDLSAARSPARSVSDPRRGGISERAGGAADPRAAPRAAPGRGRGEARSSPATRSSPCSGPSRTSSWPTS